MADRRLRAEIYRALKTDFGLLVDEIGTQGQAAELTRVDQQMMSRYQDRNRPEYPAIDVVAELLDKTRSTHVLRILAEIVGAVVIKLPEGSGPASIIESSGQLAAELGKAMMAIGQALVDGDISQAEASEIVPKLQNIIASAHALVERIKAEAAE